MNFFLIENIEEVNTKLYMRGVQYTASWVTVKTGDSRGKSEQLREERLLIIAQI